MCTPVTLQFPSILTHFSWYSSAPREKSQKAIQDEIKSVIRQITATVTFLPLLETTCKYLVNSNYF